MHQRFFKEFAMDHVKEIDTPFDTSIKLDMDENDKSIDITKYRGTIGSLLYLIASRPDNMFCVSLCARLQAFPKESHVSVVKCSFCYMYGVIDLRLWYKKKEAS